MPPLSCSSLRPGSAPSHYSSSPLHLHPPPHHPTPPPLSHQSEGTSLPMMHHFDLVVDCLRPPSGPSLCHLVHHEWSLSESTEGPDSSWLWTYPLWACCRGSESTLSSYVCESLRHDRGKASLYLTNHSPCSFCERPFSSSGAGSSLVGFYAHPLPLRALAASLPRSHWWLCLWAPGQCPLHHLTRPLRPPANELLQTVPVELEVAVALQRIPKIQLVGGCGLLAACPSELSARGCWLD